MRYLKLIDLPSTNISKEEEDYLDDELHFDLWCKKNKGRNGRNIHVTEAISIFEDSVYPIALELAKNGNNELLTMIKDKARLEFNQKIQLAKEVPIESLITTPIKMHKTLCPFHLDNNASMHIYSDTNTFWCFVCHAGGDTIDYVQRLNNCDFVNAVNLLT